MDSLLLICVKRDDEETRRWEWKTRFKREAEVAFIRIESFSSEVQIQFSFLPSSFTDWALFLTLSLKKSYKEENKKEFIRYPFEWLDLLVTQAWKTHFLTPKSLLLFCSSATKTKREKSKWLLLNSLMIPFVLPPSSVSSQSLQGSVDKYLSNYFIFTIV